MKVSAYIEKLKALQLEAGDVEVISRCGYLHSAAARITKLKFQPMTKNKNSTTTIIPGKIEIAIEVA